MPPLTKMFLFPIKLKTFCIFNNGETNMQICVINLKLQWKRGVGGGGATENSIDQLLWNFTERVLISGGLCRTRFVKCLARIPSSLISARYSVFSFSTFVWSNSRQVNDSLILRHQPYKPTSPSIRRIPLYFVQSCVFWPQGKAQAAMVVITAGSRPVPLPSPLAPRSLPQPSTSPGQFADLKCGKFANLWREVNCVCWISGGTRQFGCESGEGRISQCALPCIT